MDYAIAHGTKGTTFVVRSSVSGPCEVIRLREDPVHAPKGAPKKQQKLDFLSGIAKGDVIFVELGGAADRLSLACIAHGAEVFRMPTFRLSKERCRTVVERQDWTVDDELPYGEETGEMLTARKTRALAMFILGLEEGSPEFVKAEERDVSLMKLKVEFRAYMRSLKATLRAYQGLLSAYRDQAFLDLAFARQVMARQSDEEIHHYILERLVEDMLGGDISEAERKDFFALIGKEFEGGKIPAHATEETIETIVSAMLESDRFRATVFTRLKSQKARIEKLLKGGKLKLLSGEKFAIPANDIWVHVFEPIPGCGPLIGARFITAIGDIRRFETLPKLKAYAGYHHFEDGSRARRRAGTVSNWQTNLKQAVYLLCEQTVKMPASPWRMRLDQRKAYELAKILKARQTDADKQELGIEILPASFAARTIACVNDVRVTDYAVLATHVDALRKQAGVTSEADEDDEETATVKVKDPKLAKLVRGVKMMAHQKGMRWLGQQFLKHIFIEWRKALGIHTEPLKHTPDRPQAGTSSETLASAST